ncbi:Pre-rRNA-processing protein ipi3, partial [Coemansia erecta]
LEIGGMFTEIVGVGTANGVQVYDLRRGTKLAQCTGVGIGGRQAFGMSDSWVAGVSEKRAVCHVYMLNRGDASAKLVFPFPEEIACVQVLDGGRCIAAGAKSGRILVWATASGRMLGAWDAHYGAVTALSSSDGVLVSGGEDAAAHVWVLAQALDQLARGDTAVAPIASAAEHTMAIAAVHVTPGVLAGRGRMYTAARDHTCKQWRVRVERDGDRYAGRAELLATLLYEASVRDIAVDAGETRVFAATAAGLFQTNLYAHTRASSDDVGAQAELAALGGTGSAVYSEGHVQFVAAETDVVAVGLSHDGTLAVSASRDGTVRVWDAGSRQCLRTISDKQLAGGVAGVSVRLAPPQLGGPRTLATAGLQRPEAMSEAVVAPRIAAISFAPLQRQQRADAAEATAFEAAVKVRLPGARASMARFDAQLQQDAPYSQTGRGDVRLLGALRPADGSAKKLVADLQQQMERLQRHNARTRALNDELYQSAVSEWLGARQR